MCCILYSVNLGVKAKNGPNEFSNTFTPPFFTFPSFSPSYRLHRKILFLSLMATTGLLIAHHRDADLFGPLRFGMVHLSLGQFTEGLLPLINQK